MERKVTSVTAVMVCAAQQGGQNSAGSLNRQFNRPNKKKLLNEALLS